MKQKSIRIVSTCCSYDYKTLDKKIQSNYRYLCFSQKSSLSSSSSSSSTLHLTYAIKSIEFQDLFLANTIFKLCSYPHFSQRIVASLHYPILGPIIRFGIKYSAFRYFCGGESSMECMNKVNRIHALYGVSTILDHSVEQSESWDENVMKKIKLLQTASDRNLIQIHSIPIKCSSIMCYKMLESLTTLLNENQEIRMMKDDDESLVKRLVEQDRNNFYIGVDNLTRICKKAMDVNISLLLDAEESYRQPAVEVICRMVSKQVNISGKKPVLYNTYQMYLKRSKNAVQYDIKCAMENNYIFAAKIVRGAYMVGETKRAIELNYVNPILSSKQVVDKAYDDIVSYILSIIGNGHIDNKPYIMIATHNKSSIENALLQMNEWNIPNDSSHIYFAQILGMCDHLTISLSHAKYNTVKLISYGKFDEILPWLIRRFQENQDIFGAMQSERHLYWTELKRRMGF